MAVTFDTLELVKKLEAAGFSEAQAEGLASSLSHIQSRQVEALATKDDLKNAIKELEIKLERRIDRLEAQISLIKWMMGFLLAGVASLILQTFSEGWCVRLSFHAASGTTQGVSKFS